MDDRRYFQGQGIGRLPSANDRTSPAQEEMQVLSFLELQNKKQPVGTLVLGKRNSFRELFFEGDQVFLSTGEYSGCVDMISVRDSGLLGGVLSSSQLESIMLSDELKQTLLPQILHDQGLLDDSQRLESVARGHVREEILEMLLHTTDSFAFQEGRVPESLLDRGGLITRVSIPLGELIADLDARFAKLREIGRILPSDEEVFVVTAEGMQYRQTHSDDFALQRLLGLVDGLRNVTQLVDDSRFHECFALELIVECLDREFIKKTLLPELRDISTSALSESEAAELLPFFKNAVKHSVDQLSARELLAVIHEKLGKNEESVVQYNFIGDALYRMKKPAQAIKAYHKALTLRPDEALIFDKITRIYYEAAEEEELKGEHKQAAQLLRNALRVCPDDWQAFEKLVGIIVRGGSQRELADLCDRTTQHAKDVGDAMIAVKAYRIVLKKVDRPLPFQKKLVNAYLDFGEKKAAAALMKDMIARHLDADEPGKALDLVEKIFRLGQMSDELALLRKRLQKDLGILDRKRRSSGRRLAGAFSIIAVILAYQAWSYLAWATVKTEAVANAQTDEPDDVPPEILRPSVAEARCEEITLRCETFLARFPVSIFRTDAQELRRENALRSRTLAAMRASRKSELLKDANLSLLEGDRRKVSKILTPLMELEDGHPWRDEAELMHLKLASFAKSSQELIKDARRLETAKKPREAYKVYRQLLTLYPNSQFAKTLKLPILVKSRPNGCHVMRLAEYPKKSEFLGTTPFVYHLSPGEAFEIELTIFGHLPLKTTLYDSDGLFNIFVLFREPLWTEPLAKELSVHPVVTNDDLILSYANGRLQALDVRTLKLRGSVKRESFYSLTVPPTVTKRGVYSVWNDGTIIFLPLDRLTGRQLPRTEISLPQKGHGLPTTPIVSVDDSRVLVGTSRKRIFLLHASRLTPIGGVTLPTEPRYLERLAGSTLLATTVDGNITSVDIKTGKIGWSRDLGDKLELPPSRVGPSIVTITKGRTLYLLDPANGKDRVPPTRLRTRDRVEIDRVGECLYLLNADADLATISPQTGKVLAHQKLQIKATRVVALDGKVGLLHRGGEGFLVLDGATLIPTWAVNSDGDAYAEFHAAGEHLIARTKSRKLIRYSAVKDVMQSTPPK